MATNPSTLPENSGRITAPDAAYPFGSAKDDSTGTTGDGTPIKKALLNDTYGIIQAALQAAGTPPSGAAETATKSQVLQAINGLASGLANNYTDTGAADAYVLELKANQQKQPSLFDGLVVSFTAANANTGASTVDVSNILGQPPGTTVKNIKDADGGDPIVGALSGFIQCVYSAAADEFRFVGRVISGSFVSPQASSPVYYNIFPDGRYEQYWQMASRTGGAPPGVVPTFIPLVTSYNAGTTGAIAAVSSHNLTTVPQFDGVLEFNNGAGFSVIASSVVSVCAHVRGRWK